MVRGGDRGIAKVGRYGLVRGGDIGVAKVGRYIRMSKRRVCWNR